MKQYHITVYATVDDSGKVLGWDICEPGSEPTDSGMPVFDTDAELWTYADENTAMRLDGALSDMFEGMGLLL